MFVVKYAMKSITRRKSKNIMTVLSVALAVALLVGVGASTSGIEQALGASWWSLQAETDVEITQPALQHFPGNISELITSSNDRRFEKLDAITYTIEYEGATVYNKGKLEDSVSIFGIENDDNDFGYYKEFEREANISLSILNADGKPKGIISSTLAKNMELKFGDIMSTSVPNGQGENVPIEIEIVNIYDESVSRGHESMYRPSSRIIVNIEQLQKVLVDGMQGFVTKIRMNFVGVDRSLESLNAEDQTFLGKDIVSNGLNATEDIMAENQPFALVYSGRLDAAENIRTSIDGIRGVLNIFVVMLNLTALLLIINVQAMNIDDRRYNTAVLRAMGSSRGQIFKIFLIESTVVGMLGAIAGIGLGWPYGVWMKNTINAIFQVPGEVTTSIDQGVIVGAFVLGVTISVLTSVLPAWKASGESITEELRGIKSVTEKKNGRLNKTLLMGTGLFAVGLVSANKVGKWYEEELWHNINNHESVMFAFGMTAFGVGLILTEIIPRRAALNVSAISFLALAYVDMFWLISFVDEGNGDNIFVILLLYMVVGSSMLVVNNFEMIMKIVNRFFFLVPSMRGVSQVTTTQLVKKKGRATLLFTIFTIILIMNTFIASMSYTMTNSMVDQYEWRAQGNEISVSSQYASDEITNEILGVEGVEYVFAFRSAIMPIFYSYPDTDNSDFDLNNDLRFRRIIEIPEAVIKPNNNWDDESFTITWDDLDAELYPEKTKNMQKEEVLSLSQKVNDDFLDNTMYDLKLNYTSVETGEIVFKEMIQHQVLGGFFSEAGSDVYIQGKNASILAMKRVGSHTDFMGFFDAFGGTVMITPELADKLEVFDRIQGPNVFLVKTENTYFDDEANIAMANSIEKALNDLDDPNSLSSQLGALVGVTTQVIRTVMYDFWAEEASFWDFLGTFAAIGLIIGSLGMAIIAVRSISERMREIGMMRAIGFSQFKVVNSIIIEMVFLGVFGLITGVVNGILMTWMLSQSIFEVNVSWPITTLGIYALIVLGVALISAILPGMKASRIPPSQALRYTG